MLNYSVAELREAIFIEKKEESHSNILQELRINNYFLLQIVHLFFL